MKIIITGTNGYLGKIFVKFFLKKEYFVVGVDKTPSLIKESANFKFCQINLENENELSKLEKFLPIDVFIHNAFIIRTRMNFEKTKEKNLSLCENVFKFCFENEIPKLIYLSSAAIYGAYPNNQLDYFFKESDSQREKESAYGLQKVLTENLLSDFYQKFNPKTKVIILRPASIIGPSWKREESKKISLLGFFLKLPFLIKSSNKFSRQFIHEEDVARACDFLINRKLNSNFEIFNLAPKDYLTIDEIAKILKKPVIYCPPFILKILFYFAWLLSLGKIPTGYFAFKNYLYPINLDGSKITKLGFKYRFNSKETLSTVI